MASFVKLDSGILNSTLWFDLDARNVFITSLLMAEPFELKDPAPTFDVRSFNGGGWVVPPGWYGFVPAAGVGIVGRAGIEAERGMAALAQLCASEATSRTADFEGRRMARIDGGYLVLNFIKYRERDYTAADRSRRWRERVAAKRNGTADTRVNSDDTRSITQAEAEIRRRDQKKTGSETDSFVVPGTTLPAVLSFPCNGDPGLWPLTQWQIDRWSQLYPGVDVFDECRKALAWVEANHRKTARGMLAYLNRWIGKANDQRRGTGSAGGKTSRNVDVAREYLREKGQL